MKIKKSRKKILLGLGGTIAFSSLGIAALSSVSCSVITPGWEKKELLNIIDSADNSYNYDFSFENSSGAYSTTTVPQVLMTTPVLISESYEGQVQYEKVKVQSDDKDERYDYKVVTPTFKWKSLILASKIVVTKHDGTVEIFDNDKHEYIDPESLKHNHSLVEYRSQDPKSINSDNFKLAMKEAKKIQIGIKNDIFWVDSEGNKTKFKVSPTDFFAGWKLTNLFDTNYRHSNGGSEKVDLKVSSEYKNLSSGNKRFKPGSRFSNAYLLDMFGVDRDKLLKEDTFITDYENEKMVTLDSKTGLEKSEIDFYEVFNKTILDASYFSPVAYDFIKERVGDATEGKFGEKGEALKFGYYWYGKSYKDDLLYASPYIPNFNSVNKSIFLRNKYFARDNWENEEDTQFKKVIYKYSKYSDGKAFAEAQFKNYLEGTIISLGYSSQSETNKNYISNNFEKIGGSYSSSLNKNVLVPKLSPSFIPGSLKQKFSQIGTPSEKNYYFNDNYAKMVYGDSLENISKGGSKIAEYTFSGRSVAFRSLVNNAANAYTLAKNISPTAIPWISFASPDNKIGSKDGNATLREFTDEVNSNFVIDIKTGEKIYTKTTAEEQQQNFNNTQNANVQALSPKFEILNKEMKKLLDEFYAENKLSSDQKIEWTLHSRYTNITEHAIDAITKMTEAIKSLDGEWDPVKKVWDNSKSRLNVKFEKLSSAEKWYDVYLQKMGTGIISGWGYDYNGIGTAIDGYYYHGGDGAPYLSAAIFNALPEDHPLAKGYPTLYKYSKELVKFITEKAKDKIRPVEEWKDMPNAYDFGMKNQHSAPSFIEWVTHKIVKNGDKEEFVPIDKSFSFETVTALFNIKYQNSSTTEEAVKLVQEMNSYFGVYLQDYLLASNLSKPAIRLVNKNIIYPVTSEESLPIQDIRIKKKETK